MMKLKYLAQICLISFLSSPICFADTTIASDGLVIKDYKKIVKKNDFFKKPLATASHAQVVMMTVNKKTNPNNEIPLETHDFDQVILVIQGKAEARINGKKTILKKGDMIIVPQGSAHQIINLNDKQSLKVLTVYSATDMPATQELKTIDDKK
jgi:quercetin dioxygenase-like cupin family protein